MADLVDIADAGEIVDGQMKMFRLGDRELLVAHVGDRYYAADNRCPHLGGDLSAGKLDGTIVSCPRHRSQFDLADGHVVRWTDWTGIKLSISKTVKSPKPIKTYPVKVEGGRLIVEMEKVSASAG